MAAGVDIATLGLKVDATQVDKATQSVKQLGTEGEKTDSTARKLTQDFDAFAKQAAIVAAALTATVVALGKFAEHGGRITNVGRAFDKMTGDSTAALLTLREATSGLITDFELMTQMNRAVTLGSAETTEQFGELAETALTLGRALGVDAAFALESLSLGIGRQSRLILDNLGLIVGVEEANERYAESLGKTAEQLTDNEKREAFRTAAMESARAKIAELGGVTLNAGDAYRQFVVELQNAADEFATFVANSPEVIAFFNDLAKFVRIAAFEMRQFADDLKIVWFELNRLNELSKDFSQHPLQFIGGLIGIGDGVVHDVERLALSMSDFPQMPVSLATLLGIHGEIDSPLPPLLGEITVAFRDMAAEYDKLIDDDLSFAGITFVDPDQITEVGKMVMTLKGLISTTDQLTISTNKYKKAKQLGATQEAGGGGNRNAAAFVGGIGGLGGQLGAAALTGGVSAVTTMALGSLGKWVGGLLGASKKMEEAQIAFSASMDDLFDSIRLGGLSGAAREAEAARQQINKLIEGFNEAFETTAATIRAGTADEVTAGLLSFQRRQLEEGSEALAEWDRIIEVWTQSTKRAEEAEKERADQLVEDQKRIATAAREAAEAAAELVRAFREGLSARAAGVFGTSAEGARASIGLSQRREQAAAADFSATDRLALALVHQGERMLLELDIQTQAITDAANEQIAAIDAQLQTQRDALATAQDQLRTQEQTVAITSRVVDSLDNFASGLLLSNLSPLSPSARLQEARAQFGSLSALALGGDVSAAESLPGAARALLDASRAFNASGTGFLKDFDLVQSMVEQVREQFAGQLTVEEQMLVELQSQSASLTAQIADLEKQRQAVVDAANAQIAAAQKRHGEQMKTLADQLATLIQMQLGIVDIGLDLGGRPPLDPKDWVFDNSDLMAAFELQKTAIENAAIAQIAAAQKRSDETITMLREQLREAQAMLEGINHIYYDARRRPVIETQTFTFDSAGIISKLEENITAVDASITALQAGFGEMVTAQRANTVAVGDVSTQVRTGFENANEEDAVIGVFT